MEENMSKIGMIIGGVVLILGLLFGGCYVYDKILVNDKPKENNSGNNNENSDKGNNYDDFPDYVREFIALDNDSETVDSLNVRFGVQGVLENPEISSTSYIWRIKEGVDIRASIDSVGKIRTVEIKAPNTDFYNSKIRFASDLASLRDKENLTYSEVKNKCGNVDGVPTYIVSGEVRSYVWVSSNYQLTVTFGSSGYASSIVGLSIYN